MRSRNSALKRKLKHFFGVVCHFFPFTSCSSCCFVVWFHTAKPQTDIFSYFSTLSTCVCVCVCVLTSVFAYFTYFLDYNVRASEYFFNSFHSTDLYGGCCLYSSDMSRLSLRLLGIFVLNDLLNSFDFFLRTNFTWSVCHDYTHTQSFLFCCCFHSLLWYNHNRCTWHLIINFTYVCMWYCH